MRTFLSRLLVIIAITLIPTACASSKYAHDGNRVISPLDYGLKAAKTGEE